MWTFNSLAYVTDNGLNGARFVYLRGHSAEFYGNGQTASSGVTKATLTEISHNPAHYERTLRDGTVETYDLADRAASLPDRRVFLTSVTDPQGHTIAYTYDSSFRIVAVTDAIGQVTTLAYEASNPNLLTKVTDPFGRYATLGYDAEGRLSSITDAAGMTSTFTYTTGDFITAMTTPYGTTSFRHEPGNTSATYRVIEAVDPVGGRERLEFTMSDASLAATESSGDVPTGFSASNDYLDHYNSFYWDKLAMATHPNDRAYAVNYNWMLDGDVGGHLLSRPVPHSIKRPLESRLWFRYPNQPSTSSHSLNGSGAKPSLNRPGFIGEPIMREDGAA